MKDKTGNVKERKETIVGSWGGKGKEGTSRKEEQKTSNGKESGMSLAKVY